jgi:hypothetical protein
MIQSNKIEIHRKSELPDSKYELLIDGCILNGATVGGYYKGAVGSPNYYVIAKGQDSLNQIAVLKLKDFGTARVESIKLMNWARWEGFEISVGFNQNNLSIKETTFEVDFEPDLVNWKFPYSFNDYYKIFSQIWMSNVRFINYEKLKVGGIRDKFMPTVRAKLNGLSIGDEIEKNLKQFFEIHRKALLQLKIEQFENSILTLFSFPEEIKISCKQYLEYFATFLRDLGLNATSNLKEEAGKVLFSVTPTDDIEALDKIRKALALYLNLPSSQIVYDDSFAAMRLHQQIDNLQHSQRMAEREIRSSERELRLAQTVIENQDKIILQKDTLIEQQNKVIEKITSKSIMMDSLENKAEFEKVFDGLEFGESRELKEKLGIKFNPITSLKTFGRKLVGNDNEVTSLNLNDKIENKIIER